MCQACLEFQLYSFQLSDNGLHRRRNYSIEVTGCYKFESRELGKPHMTIAQADKDYTTSAYTSTYFNIKSESGMGVVDLDS